MNNFRGALLVLTLFSMNLSADTIKPNKAGQIYSTDYTATNDGVTVRVHELSLHEAREAFHGISFSRRRWDSIVPVAIDIDNQGSNIYGWTNSSLGIETLSPDMVYKKLKNSISKDLLIGFGGAAVSAGICKLTLNLLVPFLFLGPASGVASAAAFYGLFGTLIGSGILTVGLLGFGCIAPLIHAAHNKRAQKVTTEVELDTPVINPGDKKRIYTFIRRPDYSSEFTLNLVGEKGDVLEYAVQLGR